MAQGQTPAPAPGLPENPGQAQAANTTSDTGKDEIEEVDEGGGSTIKLLNGQPSKRRIVRNLSLIEGIRHDEEILLPDVPLSYKGQVELVDIFRIKGTDIFRIMPNKAANGIVTIHNKKTGQILVELRLDIRVQKIDKVLRELRALLADIEGIEFKIANNRIMLDGFVLLPKDLVRIGTVIKQYGENADGVEIKSIVSLSPIAKKKIVEYIAREINNPEISVTSIGDFIRLEGMVNSPEEKTRILEIARMYLPEIVSEKSQGTDSVAVASRQPERNINSFIIDLIHVRKDDDKVVPPPKMIQIVAHFVEFSDRYLKNFDFIFSPSLVAVGDAAMQPRAATTIGEMASIINNLLPKINWARNHGYIRLLDTASVLTQDKEQAMIDRSIGVSSGKTDANAGAAGGGGGGAAAGGGTSFRLLLEVKPQIKSERSGLIEMLLNVNAQNGTESIKPTTTIKTKISVRDRQSAAFGGIISKKSENQYGGPSNTQNAIITLNHGKKFEKSTSNFVVFVTPTIKSSASAGVDQVKKKFRMKD